MSRATSPVPVKKRSGKGNPIASGASTPIRFGGGTDQRQLDMSALNIYSPDDEENAYEEPPKMTLAREKVVEEAKKALDARGDGKKGVSLVVIGHVDAGKSTLMGRLLYELGMVEEKKRIANERGSSKMGKGSFSWAWELDGTTEERERGITMDIAQQFLATPQRLITILDAPGHRDFIPNMISGASQADCALLVVDAATGEFEAGFDRGGQTREHLVLVRSLGVSQVIVAVNKLDQVQWDKDRYDDICDLLRPFLLQSGFHPSKTKFVPVGAMEGVNLITSEGDTATELNKWYTGPTLVDLLDKLEPPARDLNSPLRLPISNVFKGQSSGIAVSGRVCGGVIQVGERVRVLPGDETAIVKSIEVEDDSQPWAAAGTSVTLNLVSIDPAQVNIGSVLCPVTDTIPLATVFSAKIIVFDIQVPIMAGTSVELFHHSRDVPATISKLVASLDRATGTVIKQSPRVLTKGGSAEVQITLRASGISGPSGTARSIPLEPFAANKDMGRILLRRGGETIGAGIVLKIIA
ncbi:EF Tu GTP binding domain-containing protein [Athelia psychrophila]|uniref:Elongation factor 1 alpha-like protein n=1 Tax=Athelia psychrophila TaxID=1759441 RepID=A0A167XF72_9AGAM|nr:EF Tu GTP binding domain-containing protein [Fibularhizoctonia sp. CBS 109695]